MAWIARVLGVLLIVYGLLGCFALAIASGQGFPVPAWNGQAWTADVRTAADWATCLALALGGLLLVLNNRAAILVCALGLALAAARAGYDLSLGDLSTARGRVMLQGDLIAGVAAALGLLAGLLGRRRT